LFGSGTSSQFAVQLARRVHTGSATETNAPVGTWFGKITQTLRGGLAARKIMENRIKSDFEQLDHKTCQSICDAVGERLQQDIRPESWLSSDLEHLVNELRRQDDRPDLRAI
jgi:hypothetical protein